MGYLSLTDDDRALAVHEVADRDVVLDPEVDAVESVADRLRADLRGERARAAP